MRFALPACITAGSPGEDLAHRVGMGEHDPRRLAADADREHVAVALLRAQQERPGPRDPGRRLRGAREAGTGRQGGHGEQPTPPRPPAAPAARRRSTPPAARSADLVRRTRARPRRRRSRRTTSPASARRNASASCGSSPATSGVPVAGANAGSITSMSNDRYSGSVAGALADEPPVVGRIERPERVARQDLEAPAAWLVEVGRRVERTAHPGQRRALRRDQALLQRAPERRAVEVALAVVLVPGVGMGVEQDEPERPVALGVRAQLAEHDRVVAAEHERRDAGGDERPRGPRGSGRRCAPRSRASPRGRPSRRATGSRTRRPPAADATAAAGATRRGSPPGRSGRPAGSSSPCRTGRRPPPRRRRPDAVTCGSRANVRTPV